MLRILILVRNFLQKRFLAPNYITLKDNFSPRKTSDRLGFKTLFRTVFFINLAKTLAAIGT